MLSRLTVDPPGYLRLRFPEGFAWLTRSKEPLSLPACGVCSLTLPQSQRGTACCMFEFFAFVASISSLGFQHSSPNRLSVAFSLLLLAVLGGCIGPLQDAPSPAPSGLWEAHPWPAMCRKTAHFCQGPALYWQAAPSNLFTLDFITVRYKVSCVFMFLKFFNTCQPTSPTHSLQLTLKTHPICPAHSQNTPYQANHSF